MKGIWFLVVALIWGCTNPLLKRGSVGIETIENSSKLQKALLQIKWLILNPSFTIPFLMNQSGSVLYYLTIASSDISIAVPVINSLTLVVTTIMGTLMGEKVLSVRSYLGIVCVVSGVCISIMSKNPEWLLISCIYNYYIKPLC